MLNKENIELCWKLLEIYGIEAQAIIAIEECSELQKALCKSLRNNQTWNAESVKEELVDTIVMCQQLLLCIGMDVDDVNKRAKVKLERALKNEKMGG